MAASKDDLLMEVGDPGSATTLAAPGYTSGGTSINVGSTSGWPSTTGVTFAIDEAEVVDGEEVQVAGTYNEYVGTVNTGTSINNVEWVRGVGDRNYSAGALTRVYIPVSAERENRIVEWGLVHADQDGTLKAGAVDAAAVLADNVVTTAKVLDDNITAAKLVNGNVKTIQTGGATDWSSTGTTNTDKSSVSTVTYKGVSTATGAVDKVVTFPAAYTQNPHVMVCTASAGSANCTTILIGVTTTTFTVRQITDTGTTASEKFNWESEGI